VPSAQAREFTGGGDDGGNGEVLAGGAVSVGDRVQVIVRVVRDTVAIEIVLNYLECSRDTAVYGGQRDRERCKAADRRGRELDGIDLRAAPAVLAGDGDCGCPDIAGEIGSRGRNGICA